MAEPGRAGVGGHVATVAFALYDLVNKARAAFWRLTGVQLGRDARIGSQSVFANGRAIQIGDRVRISRFCTIEGGAGGLLIGADVGIGRNSWIAGDGRIVIGDWCNFGPNLNLLSFSHVYKDLGVPIARQPDRIGPIHIGRDVWIGANVVVLPDTRIGDGAVVAANSVVRGEVPPLAIVGGAPARVIGWRGQPPERSE
jgi:galactoside O-acetyltransferase